MRIISVLAVFVLLINASVFAQCDDIFSSKYKQFRDSTGRFIGIKTRGGTDTIYPAVMDRMILLTEPRDKDGNVWWSIQYTVSNLHGLIDCSGRVVFEPVLEEVEFDRFFGTLTFTQNEWSGFVTRLCDTVLHFDSKSVIPVHYSGGTLLIAGNKKKGVWDDSGKEIIPPIYDTIIDTYPVIESKRRKRKIDELTASNCFFKVSLDGKMGVLDYLGNEVVPIIYDDVELLNSEVPTKPYWKVTSNQSVGVLTEKGEQIIDIEYKDISAAPVEIRAKVGATFFVVEMNDSTKVACDSTGKIVARGLKGRVNIFAWYCDRPGPQNFFYAICATDEGEQAVALDGSNRKSRVEEKFKDCCEGLVFKGEKSSGIITRNFEQVLTCNDCTVLARYYDNSRRSYNETVDGRFGLFEIRVFNKGYYPRSGLANSEGVQIVPPKYHEFLVEEDSSAYYPWGFQKTKGDSMYLDIYDSLGVAKRFVLTEKAFDQFQEHINTYYDHGPQWFFVDSINGKCGAIMQDGDIVIPFIYDSYSGRAIYGERSKVVAYYLTKDGKEMVVDTNGKELIPPKYKQVFYDFLPGLHRVRMEDRTFSLIDNDGKVIFSGARWIAPYSSGRHYPYDDPCNKDGKHQTWSKNIHAKKGDKLYKWKDGRFVLLD